jgi:hypothetical protein
MTINLRRVVGNERLLGRSTGEADFPRVLAEVRKAKVGELVEVDLDGIESMTSSYFAAVFLPLLQMSRGSKFHLVLKRANDDLQENMMYVLLKEKLALFVKSESGAVSVLGALDPVYEDILSQITSRKEITAKELHEQSPEKIGLTAWIKRLSTLYDLGLVRKAKAGREFVYTSILEGVLRG